MFLLHSRKFELRPHINHICSHEYCKPENESSLKKRGLIPKETPMVTNDSVFVCIYGNIHECSEYTCMNNTICPISGLSDGHPSNYSSYNRKDPRTFIKDPIKHKRKRLTDDELYEKAENLVEIILYSNCREKINEKFKRQQVKLCNKEKNAYTKEFYPVNLPQLAMVQCKYDSKTVPLEILKRDPQRIEYYTFMIVQMYKKINQYIDDKLCIESITLGLLYKMKQGLKIDGIIIIPIDLYLVEHLPVMNDLPVFNIDKRKFTKGEQWINYSIEQARKQGVSLQDIALEERHIEAVTVFKPTSRKKK